MCQHVVPSPVVNSHALDIDNDDTDSESDESNYEESASESEHEHDEIIRAKWQMDGASSLEEAVVKLENFIKYLKGLKDNGWELRGTIDDDYGFIYKK